MNKKIIVSLSVVAVVATIAIGGTIAYFSDTETSENNVITAGALDLTINDKNNPVEAVVTIEDMKPSQEWYTGPITLKVYNNPGRLYKHIVAESVVCETNGITEPECSDQGGNWVDGQGCMELPEDENYLPGVVWFDLEVWVDENHDEEIQENEWVVLIPDGSVTVDDIISNWIYLGTYGERMETNKIVIRQSFHMDGEAGNEYQSDSCTFTEEFMVTQTNATCPENMYVPENLPVLDSFDIGDTTSESGHNLTDWSNAWVKPGWGGNYGGGSSDESFRLLMGRGDTCETEDAYATFTMDAGDDYATLLTIEHLDGSQTDSFDIYVDDELIGHYDHSGISETWVTTTFCLPDIKTGSIEIKLVATEPAASWCETWGQVAFSNVELK